MKTVLVSAGHSTVKPIDSGAVGNGYKESEIALRMRDKVAAKLRAKNYIVLEDGEDGISQPLTKAIELARRAGIAVEFHLNAGPAKATGIEVLAKAKNKALAQQLAIAINLATGLVLRGDRGYKSDDSGQHHRLGFCEAGGLIVELCFISNKSDVEELMNNFDTVAENIAVVLSKVAGAETAQSETYTVKAGDTASGIARRFNLELVQLQRLNNLNSNYEIKIGQELKVK